MVHHVALLLSKGQGLTNRFSYDLPNLAFHLSIIKLWTIKVLVQGVRQWDLSVREDRFSQNVSLPQLVQSMMREHVKTQLTSNLVHLYTPMCILPLLQHNCLAGQSLVQGQSHFFATRGISLSQAHLVCLYIWFL